MFEAMEFMQLGFVEWLIPALIGAATSVGTSAMASSDNKEIARRQREAAEKAERERMLGNVYQAQQVHMPTMQASPGIASPNFRFETDASQYALENMYTPR